MADTVTRELRVAIYCRISKDHTGEAAGVERQIEDCHARVEAEPGWTLVAPPFVDNDISAYSGKHRPQYEALLDRVRAGDVQVVVAWQLSRVWRNRGERAVAFDLFQAQRIRVACVRGSDLDFSTATGRMVAGIIGEVDTGESEVKSERVARAAQQRAEKGRPNGGCRRFGFTARGMEIIPEEADVIRECARRLLAGDNLSAITHSLNDQGIKPPRAPRWQRTSLRNVLRAPHTAGRRYHKGVDVGPAVHGAILDEETWHAVRAKLATNKAGSDSNKGKYLLAGIARCGECGAKLWSHSTSANGKTYRYYACVPKSEGGCRKVFRAIGKTDKHVEKMIKIRLKDARFRKKLISADAPGGSVLLDLERDIQQTEASLIAVAEEFAGRTDEIGKRQFRAANTKLLAKLEDLQRQRGELAEATVFGDLVGRADIEAYWSEITFGRKRQLIMALADITIYPAQKNPKFDETLIDIDFERKRSRGLAAPADVVDAKRRDFEAWLADQPEQEHENA